MQVEMTIAGAGLLRPPSTFFSTPQCSPPPSWSPPPRSTTTTTTRKRIRSSRINESYSSYSTSTTTDAAARTTATVKLTYLEFNGWVWELDGGLGILVDPILVGNLDFGMPWLFDGAHKTLKQDDLANFNLAGVDLLLITSSLDDHCHLRTLTRISAMSPHLPIITTPNARPVISALPFTNVIYLEPGQSTAINGTIEVLATPGSLVGPPWQRPENGYILTATATTTTGQHNYSIHYEAHCVYDAAFLRDRGLHADILITPVVKQLVSPGFTLVRGQEDAVDLAKLLQASYVVPLNNGEFDAKGLLTAVLATQGTNETFKSLLREELPQALVMEPSPGVPLHLHLNSSAAS